MRILHTSDWHLGMPLKTGTMEDDQRYFLDQLYKIIQTEQADAVLCAGDIYDSSIVSVSAIELYNEAVTQICIRQKVPMVVIAGNHDSAARLASCRELLKCAGLYVSGRIGKEIEPVLLDYGKTAVYPIPYFNRDEAAALFPEKKEQLRTQEAATAAVCDHIRETMDSSRVNIILAHAFIVNAELSDSDRAAWVGRASAVSKDVFHGFDYVALGHIHKPQRITDTIRYCGSPLKYSFGSEEKHQKGVLLFDTESGEVKEIPLKMLHDRRTVEGSYEELTQMKGIENDYLRMIVTDRFPSLELFAELSGQFPFLLELLGKRAEAEEGYETVSVEDLHKMDGIELLLRFMEERYQEAPNEAQLELFREALAQSEERGEMS